MVSHGCILLSEGQTLFVNDKNEGWKIIPSDQPIPLPQLHSNQEEADTRMFFTVTVNSLESFLIVLFVAFLNETRFRKKT